MSEHVEVRPGAYHDSVTLMQVSRRRRGGRRAWTPPRSRWRPTSTSRCSAGWASTCRPAPVRTTCVVALRAVDDDALAAADAAVAARSPAPAALRRRRRLGVRPPPATTGCGPPAGADAGAGLASPGQHAFVEAMDALDAGLT